MAKSALPKVLDKLPVVCYKELRLAGMVTPVVRSQPRFSAFPPAARCYSDVTEGLRSLVQAGVRVKVTVTSADVTVTSTVCGKIRWQAGMSKGISDVRSYMGFEAGKPGSAHRRRPGKVRNTSSRPECPKERRVCQDIWRERGETIGIFEKF
jgi:hypothetical protein